MEWVIYTKDKNVQGGHWVEHYTLDCMYDVCVWLERHANEHDRVMIAKVEGDDGTEG